MPSNGKKKRDQTELLTANRSLQEMFMRLRRRYWINEGQRLPGLEKVMVGFVEMAEHDGRHIFDPGHPDRLHYIPIDTGLIDNYEECTQVLLHEMAHLTVDEQRLRQGEETHGQMWRNEMARLVKLGAVILD